jgi:SAM-dependent methyltransferase
MQRQKFDEQFERFVEMSKADKRFVPKREDFFPCLDDDTDSQGYDPHYVLFCGWAARKLAESRPVEHHDFGSSMYFLSIVSAFVPLKFHDIRHPNLPFRDYDYSHENLTSLSFKDGSLDSMSCLHVLEHCGLGRYGDELDAAGDRKAAKELTRVLAPGGELLLAVPMEDPPRTCFNAHRLYSYEMVMDLFPTLALAEFSLITNDAQFIPRCSKERTRRLKYCCGCFRFVKL